MNPPASQSPPKVTWLIGAVLFTVSVSGYFMGLRQTGSQISLTRPVSLVTPETGPRGQLVTSGVPVAVVYARQDWLRDGPNAHWKNPLSHLAQPAADPAGLTNVTAAERAVALAERAARRAFDGAPPVVPHPIAQESSAACLACHGPGLVVKDRMASKISHPPYANCTQCHVPAGGGDLPARDPLLASALAGNTFVASVPPSHGARAWPQAPPVIPHSTFMRSDCLSCHGPRALFGLRTPHPDRQACIQCHAANAVLDQHAFSASAPAPPARSPSL